MMDRIKKRHPALKHGAYSSTRLLPGESAADFEKLHRNVIAELVPNGVVEDDIVATLTRLLWRKQNLETYKVAERAKTRNWQIRSEYLPAEPELMQWLQPREPVDPVAIKAARRSAEDAARKELGDAYDLIELGEMATIDCLLKDLDIQDRLDAMIDKCLKRLLFVRGLKSISVAPPSAPKALTRSSN
jgi:hypothetical protein